ncbi:unnamed protein product [Phytomonas sp. Hart1]|nr:unnamed protein product [Phytomonas sp. Hart1]|eukprot:CCW69826.1 unnamed protein product [Phytomonas sp. isolate Hart1]
MLPLSLYLKTLSHSFIAFSFFSLLKKSVNTIERVYRIIVSGKLHIPLAVYRVLHHLCCIYT